MRNKITHKIELLRKNGDESFVRILGQNNENMGTMKINTSLLPSELASNQYYSITFRNEYNADDYINVATITDLHPSGEYCPKFSLTGKVTYTHTMDNKCNGATMVSMIISGTDGQVFQGMTYSNTFSNNTLVKKDDEITVEVSLAKQKDTEKNKNVVKYNFYNKSQSEIAKDLDGKKEKKNTVTPVDSEVKKAQNEIEKLLDKLAKKGWISKETPKTPCTAIGFQSTVHSTTNAVNIIDIRALEAILKSDVLQEVSKKLFSMKKGVDVEYKTCKEQLPALVPMAQVNAKKRTKETCTSNGLVFLDVDGIEYSLCERILSYIKENEDINSKVLIWNLSPSRKGFHLIFAPFDGVDTIVANQEHICSVINAALECEIKPDAQCFDTSRAAFITSEYHLGGAASLLTVDNPTVLPHIQEGVAYKPAAKKMVLKKTKTSDGCTFELSEDGEYPDMDDVSVHIDTEDFQTLDCYAYGNKYVEGKRHQWWKHLGVRFRSKGYTQTLAEPIFDYAMEYVQLLPEYKDTVDDPINSDEAFDAYMWAFKKENWEAYSAIPTTIADEDLPLGLRKSTSVSEFTAQFAELEDDLPELFRRNSDTFFDSEKNLNLLPFQVMSTAELLTSYTSGIKHVDYNDETFKNALQMIFVADTGDGKSSVTRNNKEGFGKILHNEFAHYMSNEFNESESTSTTLPNATNAKVKYEIFRANKNNMETPVLHTQCSEMGLFRKQQNSPHGGLDFEMMKIGWDGDTFNCATKSKDGVSGFVDSLHLSVLISAVPEVVVEHTPKTAITDGTVNRMCFCFAQTDDEEDAVRQPYDSEAIAKYVEWARKQRGTIYLEDVFGDEAKTKKNNIWGPYLKIWKVNGYKYLKKITKRTSINAKRIAREYYLMDLYEKGYNLIEHEGKTKVVKDNIISDMPKAEPWLIQLMRVTYEYLVFGVHTLFGERAARICAKSTTKSGKKQMYIDIYNALPDSFSKEELKAKVLALGKNEKAINNLVTNWNKNEVWTFDQATGMYTKKCAA